MPFVHALRLAEAAEFMRSEFLTVAGRPVTLSRWYDGTEEAAHALVTRWAEVFSDSDTTDGSEELESSDPGEPLALLELAIDQLAAQCFVTITTLAQRLAGGEADYLVLLTSKGRAWVGRQDQGAVTPNFMSQDL